MVRRVEGTTLAGYCCDSKGCDQNGAWTPVLVVPWKGKDNKGRVIDEEERDPITTFVDQHFCQAHFSGLNPYDVFSSTLRKGIRDFAEARNGEADFGRAYIDAAPTASSSYLSFQQNSGLVPKTDAVAEGAIELP